MAVWLLSQAYTQRPSIATFALWSPDRAGVVRTAHPLLLQEWCAVLRQQLIGKSFERGMFGAGVVGIEASF